MKLYLIGHNCKYAVEQMLLTLYPDERPEYPDGEPEGDCAVITFTRCPRMSKASCVIHSGLERYKGLALVSEEALTADELSEQRQIQRVVKLAFYRAALKQLGEKPAWGAITGIRPAKLMTAILDSGASHRAAITEFCRRYDTDRDKAQLCYFAAGASRRVRAGLTVRDICLYVGIPFCPTRCAYCSFVSQSVQKSFGLVEPYLAALSREMDAAAAVVREMGLNVVSVYIGGGTPTTLSAPQLGALCRELREKFSLPAGLEFTVEAGRPDTIDAEKISALLDNGVTRVSINPQTLNDAVLKNIGRSHTAAEFERACAVVQRAGGLQVNMDLIAGLPGDTPASFENSLRRVMELKPENITIHNLAHKKGSAITMAGTEHMPPRAVGRILAAAQSELINRGWFPYYLYRQKFTSGGFENVGWSMGGYENIYNVCIMEELCSIFAMGGGASTKLVAPSGRIERVFDPKYPAEYISGIDKICADKNKIREFYKNAVFTD